MCRLLALLLLAVVSPASADWLVTLDGKLIETDGPWTIDGETLTYVDLEGVEHTLDVAVVDLEGSEETTALKAGLPYEPKQEPEAEPAGGKKAGKKKGKKEPKVILYMTSLCRSCAQARELLEELGVDFVEKDINASPKARREYKKKAGRGGGLPVIDFDGRLVFRYNAKVIRQRVEELKEKEAAGLSHRSETGYDSDHDNDPNHFR